MRVCTTFKYYASTWYYIALKYNKLMRTESQSLIIIKEPELWNTNDQILRKYKKVC